jgi:hypothetical protein
MQPRSSHLFPNRAEIEGLSTCFTIRNFFTRHPIDTAEQRRYFDAILVCQSVSPKDLSRFTDSRIEPSWGRRPPLSNLTQLRNLRVRLSATRRTNTAYDRGGKASAPESLLNSSTTSRSRGKSRMAFSSSSAIKGVGSSPTSFLNSA